MPDECFCPENPQPVHRLSRFSSNSIIVFQKKNARSQLTGQKIPCNFYILTPTPPPPLFWNYRGCSVRDRDYLVQISLYQTLPDSSSLRKNNASHRKKFENSVPCDSGLRHRLFQMSNNNYPSIPFMHNGVSFHFSVFLKKSQEGHVKKHVLFFQLINIRQKCLPNSLFRTSISILLFLIKNQKCISY